MKEEVMGTKKSDCVAMFPESIEKVQKSMPKETELDKEMCIRDRFWNAYQYVA